MSDLGLSKKDLQELVAAAVSAAVQESRKPSDPTPEEQAKIDSARAHRKDMALLEALKTQSRRANQMGCSHMRKNGTTPSVYVQNGNYMICQHCTGMIKPGSPSADELKYGTPYIYDTDLFNRLLQLHIDGKDSM